MKQKDSNQRRDKQLRGISLDTVLEKRRLEQALNAKEFAVCVGVSYSTARSWFRLAGFPAFHGVVFWQDFVQWRSNQNGIAKPPESPKQSNAAQTSGFPPRAAKILRESRQPAPNPLETYPQS
jgi:hypothetical protein